MPNIIRTLCARLVVGSLVAFTGCGGDDKKSDSGSGDNASTQPATTETSTPSETTPSETGGGDKAAYKAGAEKAANDFKESAQAASEEVKAAGTVEERLKGLDSLKASVTQAADDFEALDPPADVKADNDELVSEFRDLASIVDEVKSAVKSKDQAAAQAALGKLGQSQSAITTTITRIESKIGK
jgi:hypothetical protein